MDILGPRFVAGLGAELSDIWHGGVNYPRFVDLGARTIRWKLLAGLFGAKTAKLLVSAWLVEPVSVGQEPIGCVTIH